MMRMPVRDQVATLLVAIGLLVYGAWALGFELPFVASASGVAATILVVGVAASASAVVPAFDELLRGSKPYLAIASALGAVALAAGIVAILQDNALALALLAVTTVALWFMSTNRHIAGSPQTRLGPR